MDYLTRDEALKLLSITSRQTLYRYVLKHNIDTKDMGNGKPKLYLKTDIERAIKPKKEIAKYIPKKTKAKIIKTEKKKEKIVKEKIVKNTESKQKAKDNLDDEELSPLNKIGQNEFIRVEQMLKDKGTFHEEDRGLLLAYSISYQNYINAVVQSGNNDNTTTDDFGNLKVHPYFTIGDKCLTQMTKLSNMLGISTRARIGLEIKQKKTGLMADILGRRNK